MMRTEFPEEATTLLEEQAIAHREGGKRVPDKKKKRMLRAAIGVVTVVGVLVGCVAAIDVAAMHSQAEMNAEAEAHADEVGYALTTDLETQSAMLGWSSFSHSWCKVRSAFKSYTYCLLTGDSQKCQEEASAACAAATNSTSGGSGSGSGSW